MDIYIYIYMYMPVEVQERPTSSVQSIMSAFCPEFRNCVCQHGTRALQHSRLCCILLETMNNCMNTYIYMYITYACRSRVPAPPAMVWSHLQGGYHENLQRVNTDLTYLHAYACTCMHMHSYAGMRAYPCRCMHMHTTCTSVCMHMHAYACSEAATQHAPKLTGGERYRYW